MSTSVIVGHEYASKLAAMLLVESWIVSIEYWRSGWNITLATEEDHRSVKAGFLSHPFELVLFATEISVVRPELWSESIASAPVDIAALPDMHDALAALLLFNSVAYKVTEARTNAGGDLLLCFGGGRSLVVRGHIPYAEDEWSIANKWPAQGHADVFLGADAGTFYAFPQAHVVSASASYGEA